MRRAYCDRGNGVAAQNSEDRARYNLIKIGYHFVLACRVLCEMVNVTYDASGSLLSTYSSDPEVAPAVYDTGSIAFVLVCSALVMIMSPGVRVPPRFTLRSTDAA